MSVKELTVEAKIDNLHRVIAFADQRLEELGCSNGAQIAIDLALEELFVNVASYAYQKEGQEKPDQYRSSEQELVSIRVEDAEDPLCVDVTIVDYGVPFDPLAREDPDITLSAEKRRIGGLGIFLVKKSMDHVHYEFKDGKNILTFKKYL